MGDSIGCLVDVAGQLNHSTTDWLAAEPDTRVCVYGGQGVSRPHNSLLLSGGDVRHLIANLAVKEALHNRVNKIERRIYSICIQRQ